MVYRVYGKLDSAQLLTLMRAQNRVTPVSQHPAETEDTVDGLDGARGENPRDSVCRRRDLNPRPWDYDSAPGCAGIG